jgi:membrane-associated phospholipid phosphatase
MPTYGSLFTDLGQDLRQLPSRESAVIIGIGAALGAGAHHNDPYIAASAATNETFDEAFDAGSVLGSGWMQLGGAFTMFAIGRGNGYHKLAITGADLFRAQLLNGAITLGVKVAVDRTRPDGRQYSFPSGHTSSTFASAAVLQRHYGWKAGLPAYGIAAYVGSSRVAENKHYLSDVIVGAAIGVVCGRTTSVGRGRARMALSPIATRGGAGLQFTWLGRQDAQGG